MISRKKDCLREIAMMIRKESVTFEPADRVPIDIRPRTGDGGGAPYSVGGVWYDFDTSGVCFDLYRGGTPVRPAAGVHGLALLTGAELAAVRGTVERYCSESLSRARNMARIEEAVARAEGGSITFGGDGGVVVSVDRERGGVYEQMAVRGVFAADGAVAGAGCRDLFAEFEAPQGGGRCNYPLRYLSDMGVSAVAKRAAPGMKAAMEAKALERRAAGVGM